MQSFTNSYSFVMQTLVVICDNIYCINPNECSDDITPKSLAETAFTLTIILECLHINTTHSEIQINRVNARKLIIKVEEYIFIYQ